MIDEVISKPTIGDFDASYYRERKPKKRSRLLVSKKYVDSSENTKGLEYDKDYTTNFFSASGTGVTQPGSYSQLSVGTDQLNSELSNTSNVVTTMSGDASLTNTNIGFYWDGNQTSPMDFNDWKNDNWFKKQIQQPIYYDRTEFTINEQQFNNLEFMENVVQFFSLPGYEKKDLKVQVIKDQVQISAEREEIEFYDTDESNCIFKNAIRFNAETHDPKAVSVSFLNGLLRIEIPLRKDIVEDIAIS